MTDIPAEPEVEEDDFDPSFEEEPEEGEEDPENPPVA